MAVAIQTKSNVLLEVVPEIDLVDMILDMERNMVHNDVMTELRSLPYWRKCGVSALKKTAVVYKNFVFDDFEERVCMWDEFQFVENYCKTKGVSKFVQDITRDIAVWARCCDMNEFQARLIKHYGSSKYMCKLALAYMNNAIKAIGVMYDIDYFEVMANVAF